MPVDISLKITPPDAIKDLVKDIDTLTVMNAYRPAMRKSLDLIREQLRIQPPSSRQGTFLKNSTRKQQRAYFARVNSGEIKTGPGGKYIRTNRLQKGWKRSLQEVKTSQNGIIGIQPNDAQYAGWVQGNADNPPRQQRFHTVTGWSKTIEVLEKNQEKIADIFAKDIDDRF